MFVVIRMLPFTVAPYLACLLVLLAPTLAQDTDAPQPLNPDQPPILGSQPSTDQTVQPTQSTQATPQPLLLIDTSDFESTNLKLTTCPPEQVRKREGLLPCVVFYVSATECGYDSLYKKMRNVSSRC